MEVVSPVEVEIPTLRSLVEAELEESEWVKARYEQLSMIEERRLAAICHGQLCQGRMRRAFNKKVRPRDFYSRGLGFEEDPTASGGRPGQIGTKL